jgi:acetyl esterase/lipase
MAIRTNLFRGLLRAAGATFRPPRDVEIYALTHFGVNGEWMIPSDASTRHCILYLHGGGYAQEPTGSRRAMVAHIAKASGIRVFLVLGSAFDDALSAYRWLLQQGYESRNVAIAGEATGAAHALALATTLKEALQPMPGRVFCLSPWPQFARRLEEKAAAARITIRVHEMGAIDQIGSTMRAWKGRAGPVFEFVGDKWVPVPQHGG